MDESDKMIRQKLSGLDTPPPGTNWRPQRGWSRVQAQLQPEKRPRKETFPWYYYAAAAFLILLIPFAVMLTDIRQQQAQIDRLAAELEKEKWSTTPKDRPVAAAKPVTPEPVKPEPPAREQKGADGPDAQIPVSRKAAPQSVIQARKVAEPEPAPQLPVRQEMQERIVSTHPAEGEKQEAVPGEQVAAPQLQIVISRPGRKSTSVTLHFPGNGTESAATDVALETEKPRQKQLLRVFVRKPAEEDRLPAPAEPIPPVLSAKLR